jgi:hypothetical protein
MFALTLLGIKAEDGNSGSYARIAITFSYFAETSTPDKSTT